MCSRLSNSWFCKIHTKMKTPSSNITKTGGGISYLSKHLLCVKWSHLLASSAKLRFYGLSPLYNIMLVDKVQSDIFQNVNILRVSYFRLRHVAQWMVSWWSVNCDLEFGFEFRLIKARESASCMCWLKLTCGKPTASTSKNQHHPVVNFRNNFSYILVTSVLKYCSCTVCFKNCIRCFEHKK